ncbi:LacI family DNA-binding transcriptional regulator [Pseudactinotalea sp.]|uniref:LacI family DNA-binding transcriptional regulator n=1 Tax=Pseudactinotalea sp. TaxID=1926260 RepID=UPI003B3B9C74
MAESKVTLSDVAKVAGVSLSTASKALSGTDRVSDKTRERIREIARRLDFQPNALAQSFARGRSQTIGILTQNATGTWSAPIFVGAASYLGRHEQATLLYDAEFDAGVLEASIRRLQARRIDGLLVIGDGPHYTLRSVSQRFTVPVAYAFTSTDSADDTTYVPDGEMAGRTATRHLLEIGRRKIAHLTAADDVAATERERGMAAALAEVGLSPVAVHSRPDWSEETGIATAAELLRTGVEFDAIFCGNDHLARGAEKVLLEHGLRIPDDVALVGVDNWEGTIIGQGTRHLTTVDPLLTRLGVSAAEYATGAVAASGIQRQPCVLVLGETTLGPGMAPTATP